MVNSKKELKEIKDLRKEHCTKSKYWHFTTDQKEKFQFLKYIKFFLRPIKKILENMLNIKISRNTNEIYKEYDSYILNHNVKKLRAEKLADELITFFRKLKLRTNRIKIKKLIHKHDNFFYKENLIKDNYGGIGYNNSLILFIFSELVKVNTVIESGVWKGYTTSIFDKTLKNAEKYCFDINFSKLIYKSKEAKYINFDLDEYTFDKKKKLNSCLAFFDDHVSQYNRFLFCDKNKIPYIVFDDDVDYLTVHSDGWPPIPTISMMRNYNKSKSNFKWKSLNRLGVANLKKINSSGLKNYYYFRAPNLFRITGYQSISFMSFLVRKK